MPKTKGRNQLLFSATHMEVLNAASALFAEHGYAVVTTHRIAEAAGVAHGSVFHHYKSKRDLFIAVHDAHRARLRDQLDCAAAEALDPRSRVQRICTAYLTAAQDAATRRILLLDGPYVIGLQEMRRQRRDVVLNSLTIAIEPLVNRCDDAPTPSQALAVLLRGALDQAAIEMACFPENAAVREAILAETSALIDRLT